MVNRKTATFLCNNCLKIFGDYVLKERRYTLKDGTVFNIVRYIGSGKHMIISQHDTIMEAFSEILRLEEIGHFRKDLGIVKVTKETVYKGIDEKV